MAKEKVSTAILKNTKMIRVTNIWIDQDYPKELREERKILIEQMKEAMNDSHKAHISYN